MKKLLILFSIFSISLIIVLPPNVSAITLVTTCGILSTTGETYVLDSDIAAAGSCFIINADDIILDGNGFKITGPALEAVLLDGVSEVVLKNLILESVTIGVHLSNSDENKITDSLMQSVGIGIQLDQSDDNELLSNTISQSGGTYGFRLDFSNGNVIKDNIQTGASNSILSTNSFSGTIKDNHLSDSSSAGIYLNGAGGYMVSGNTLTNNDQGIQLDGGGGHTIINNIFETNSNSGIRMTSSQNSISRNLIDSNVAEGILVLSGPAFTSQNNLIFENTIQENNIGIDLDGDNNQIYNNNFINNPTQAISSGSGNVFNLASPTGGNFWNNFDEPPEGCNNVNNDDFCDSPFVFAVNQDNLPWTKQNGWLPSEIIGGQVMSTNVTALLLSGIQFTTWLIPVALFGVGAGLFLFIKNNSCNNKSRT